MNTIRSIKELNKRELEAGVAPEASWHRDYADTAFIYVGGLPFDLTEGDVITIFSQYGEPTYVNLVRDKETGKSKGFAFLRYEDQRSTDLAVDNLGGAEVLGRILRVDHTRYKAKEGETIVDNTMGDAPPPPEEESEESEEERPLLKEEIELQKLMRDYDEEDPMKAYLVEEKKAEVEKALAKLKRRSRRDKDKKERSRRQRDDDRDRRHIRNGSEEQSDRDKRKIATRSRSPDRRRRHRHRPRSRTPERRSRRERSRSRSEERHGAKKTERSRSLDQRRRRPSSRDAGRGRDERK